MRRGRNPSVGSYPGVSHIVFVIEAVDADDGTPAAELARRDVAEITARLGSAVVATEERQPHEVIAELLIERRLTVAVAESLTGGRVADLLVSVPGISAVFKAGFAPYANEAKRDILGVSQQILDDHGAVSEECARAMAEGARRVAGADLAVATTGIAGPTGAGPGKPVGTVFLALAKEGGTDVRRLQIVGDREQVRARATMTALDLLRRAVR
jgi:nicotinamide-nucleotide amidase